VGDVGDGWQAYELTTAHHAAAMVLQRYIKRRRVKKEKERQRMLLLKEANEDPSQTIMHLGGADRAASRPVNTAGGGSAIEDPDPMFDPAGTSRIFATAAGAKPTTAELDDLAVQDGPAKAALV
jgi:hypothetical protein